jgi:Tol biopolymer transport system component
MGRVHLGANGSADIYRVRLDGTALERLTDDPAYDDQPAFSPDGTTIAFVSTRGSGYARVWLLDVATRAAASADAIDRGDFRPSWSPDGQWIAFSSGYGALLEDVPGRWEEVQSTGHLHRSPRRNPRASPDADGRICGHAEMVG